MKMLSTTLSTEGLALIEMANSCEHCAGPLSIWRIPSEATWSDEFLHVCFNDDCPYYTRGWTWMMQQFSQKASYRYALNPRTGYATMIPVWSASATREQIVDDKEEEER